MPEYRFFQHEVWRRLTARTQRQWSKHPFGYPPIEGVPALREAIAHHVAFSRAVACGTDEIVVTSGAQQAFDLLARLLVTPGRTRVAVEEPGYPPLRYAFLATGAKLVPVPVDDEGLRVDLLPADVDVVCVTPSHQSPTGAALSLPRRVGLHRVLGDRLRARFSKSLFPAVNTGFIVAPAWAREGLLAG